MPTLTGRTLCCMCDGKKIASPRSGLIAFLTTLPSSKKAMSNSPPEKSSFNNTPDSEDHLYKLGVQIHRLEDVLKEYSPGSVFVRHIDTERDDTFYKKLSDIHKEIHNKPYDLDINDWLLAKLNLIIPNFLLSEYLLVLKIGDKNTAVQPWQIFL